MRRWSQQCSHGHFVFTSNVDGHFIKAGFNADRVVECHGSVHFLQPFESEHSRHIWPSQDTLATLRVNPETFLAEGDLPMCPPEAGAAAGRLARPNVLMFGDNGWVSTRTADQHARMDQFVDGLPKHTNVVVIEIGAGTAIPTVRMTSENMLHVFPNATLLRINPAEPEGPGNTIQIPMGGKDALVRLEEALGAGAGVGAEAGVDKA